MRHKQACITRPISFKVVLLDIRLKKDIFICLYVQIDVETEICVYYHESIPNGCRCHPHKIRGLAQAEEFFRKEADNVRPRPRISSASTSAPMTSSAAASMGGSPSRRQMIVTTSRQSPGALSLIRRRSDQR